jgi:hypothetical protein
VDELPLLCGPQYDKQAVRTDGTSTHEPSKAEASHTSAQACGSLKRPEWFICGPLCIHRSVVVPKGFEVPIGDSRALTAGLKAGGDVGSAVELTML